MATKMLASTIQFSNNNQENTTTPNQGSHSVFSQTLNSVHDDNQNQVAFPLIL
ncbi:hypothetical protein BJ969_000769 [Saccharopolyspora gloriosae]|uniref:Uncharacterized protein n=1 Tax=Saccharopolyspora gloriosae TaxID=455344 RepID=A0A840NA19_9PSEU|nr:hypothetical protein [Saccharopolyspora gloriosae]